MKKYCVLNNFKGIKTYEWSKSKRLHHALSPFSMLVFRQVCYFACFSRVEHFQQMERKKLNEGGAIMEW